MLFLGLLLTLITFVIGDQYECMGGECLLTSHSLNNKIDRSEIKFNDTDILEWHFHVYFFQTNPVSVNGAKSIQEQLINAVANHEFLVVLNGVTSSILPDLNDTLVPDFNMHPVGPHPCGSFEVWVTKEYLAQVMSWFMLNRGQYSVLLHPLSSHSAEDHSGRLMWLGKPYRIDYWDLSNEFYALSSEYVTLQLGYNYSPESPYAPQNWIKNKK